MEDYEVSVDFSTLQSKSGHSCPDPDTAVRLKKGGGASKALGTGSDKHFWAKEIISV